MNDTPDTTPPLTERHLEPDLHAAAFLLARGYDLIALEPVGRRFAFEFSPEAHASAVEYRNGGMVEAQTFADCLVWLKGRLYAEKFRNGNGENVGQQKQHRR